MDMAARVKLYGTDPVFIFDPNNKTNRPVKGIHDNATIYWPLYPEKLRQMFTKAFTVGLNEPSKRITEPEWMTLFSNMMSGIPAVLSFSMMRIWKQRVWHILVGTAERQYKYQIRLSLERTECC